MIKYIDKNSTNIASSVIIGEGTTIYPHVMLEGNCVIGKNCVIHFGTYIKDSVILDNTIIYNSFIIGSKIGTNSIIGPYAHIRENNVIKNDVKIGSFVELKNSCVDENTVIPHLAYVGDAIVGKNVNISCGVITANYDGKNKYETKINDDAFIGSNVTLIAPIVINKKAFVAAGSTINQDVPYDNFAIARQGQINKKKRED